MLVCLLTELVVVIFRFPAAQPLATVHLILRILGSANHRLERCGSGTHNTVIFALF